MLRRYTTIIGSICIGLFGWHLVSTYMINPVLLPSPARVFNTGVFLISSGELLQHIQISLIRVAVGFFGGSVLAVLVGLAMGKIVFVRDFFDPPIEFMRALPPIAIIPLVVVWVGIGELAKEIVVGYGSFFVVLVNTIAGVSSTPRFREIAAQCLGAKTWQVFLFVNVPSAVPYILTGMRVALGISFMSVVAAEMIAADSGVGFLIWQSRLLIQTDRIFVGLATLGGLGFTADRLFRWLTGWIAGRYTVQLGKAAI
jgi:ABC-type nitrate/sulfonate/bicarbonate transport system permease component